MLSVVIPTRDRPRQVEVAVESALAQTLSDVEVVVVDDGSEPPLALAPRARVRCVRRARGGGASAARNAGLRAARGRFVTFLDDDNRLLPHMAAASLEAIAGSNLPGPVAAISGVEVVDGRERVLECRIPPTHPRGGRFSLESLPAGRSHMTKVTLVAERELLLGIGGFDESLPTRELSDLFLRLNPVCSIVGLTTVTYRLRRGPGPRLSRDPARLEEGVRRLLDKHAALLAAHPRGHADVLLGHARMSLVAGPRRAVLPTLVRAARVAPGHTARVMLNPVRMARVLLRVRASG